MGRGAPPTRSIAELGEFGFLARLLRRLPVAPGTVVGPGQDCAVVRCGGRDCLLTVDALVEDVHFDARWLSPRQVGRKSFLVNASDVAAMGGQPRFCVVSLGVPAEYAARQLSALEDGIVAAARDCGAAVVGGNLTRARTLFISITLLAEAPRRRVTRQGACPGDRIYVTGTLGDAALAVHELRRGRRRPAAQLVRRFAEPPARLRAGRYLVESGLVSAMIDVSDGLLQDLGHICAQSRVGARIDAERIPVSAAYRRVCATDRTLALSGGEDYELLCTLPERSVRNLERDIRQLGCPLTCIGEITSGRRVRLMGPDGGELRVGEAGYDHFRQPPR
jgi:thiamine-monophosphate kinase